MAQEVRAYFAGCPVLGKSTAATGVKLARGGVDDMDALCDLLEHQPEKLLGIRNVGPKSMLLIEKVCAVYRSERGDAL